MMKNIFATIRVETGGVLPRHVGGGLDTTDPCSLYILGMIFLALLVRLRSSLYKSRSPICPRGTWRHEASLFIQVTDRCIVMLLQQHIHSERPRLLSWSLSNATGWTVRKADTTRRLGSIRSDVAIVKVQVATKHCECSSFDHSVWTNATLQCTDTHRPACSTLKSRSTVNILNIDAVP